MCYHTMSDSCVGMCNRMKERKRFRAFVFIQCFQWKHTTLELIFMEYTKFRSMRNVNISIFLGTKRQTHANVCVHALERRNDGDWAVSVSFMDVGVHLIVWVFGFFFRIFCRVHIERSVFASRSIFLIKIMIFMLDSPLKMLICCKMLSKKIRSTNEQKKTVLLCKRDKNRRTPTFQ